jgi:hypothetical protein
LNLPPDGAGEQYRKSATLSIWREGGERLDSMMVVPGPLAVRSTVDVGGQSIPIGRPLSYGPNSTQTVSGNLIWNTPGDRFVLQAYDPTGTLVREIRLPTEPRAVTEAQREQFREAQREGLERARGFGMPEQIIESELAKIEQMPFADNHAAVGMLTSDNVGRLWVTTGTLVVDSILTYGIFSANGELLGKITMPTGFVLDANTERVVIRREDEATGLVRLEVYGLNPVCEEC